MLIHYFYFTFFLKNFFTLDMSETLIDRVRLLFSVGSSCFDNVAGAIYGKVS